MGETSTVRFHRIPEYPKLRSPGPFTQSSRGRNECSANLHGLCGLLYEHLNDMLSMVVANSSAHPAAWRLPRWLAVCLWIFGISAFHIVLPWVISGSAVRHEWRHCHPSLLNLASLLSVAIGLAVIVWALAEHFVHGSKGYEFSATPSYLIRSGPYHYTRNPMYVAALLVWVGWSFFYGSIPLLISSAAIWILLEFIIIPFEERRLMTRFGQSYLSYKVRVARWIGHDTIKFPR
jgi:protein-S-isoprenylcysteine O-methyltransferase Ste14